MKKIMMMLIVGFSFGLSSVRRNQGRPENRYRPESSQRHANTYRAVPLGNNRPVPRSSWMNEITVGRRDQLAPLPRRPVPGHVIRVAQGALPDSRSRAISRDRYRDDRISSRDGQGYMSDRHEMLMRGINGSMLPESRDDSLVDDREWSSSENNDNKHANEHRITIPGTTEEDSKTSGDLQESKALGCEGVTTPEDLSDVVKCCICLNDESDGLDISALTQCPTCQDGKVCKVCVGKLRKNMCPACRHTPFVDPSQFAERYRSQSSLRNCMHTHRVCLIGGVAYLYCMTMVGIATWATITVLQ